MELVEGTYLADEDWQTLKLFVFGLNGRDVLFYVLLQCRHELSGVDIGAVKVVVNVDEIETAFCAVADKV